jgi:hypothetical protein
MPDKSPDQNLIERLEPADGGQQWPQALGVWKDSAEKSNQPRPYCGMEKAKLRPRVAVWNVL